MKFTPWKHQEVVTKHIMKTKRCAVWCFMGAGKTGAALDALNQLSLYEEVFPALVIAPLRVARHVWPAEVKEWDDFNQYKVSVVIGNKDERGAALNRKSDIYSVNFENIPWLIEALKGTWPFKTIIVDESRKLKGFRLRQGTARSKALSKVAFRSERFIELTGTPATKGLEDLWGQGWFLDKGERLGRTYTAYMMRWFRESYDGFTWEPMPHAQKEIEDKLKDLCLSIRAADYFPTEKPISRVIPVVLPTAAMRQYRAMEKELFAELNGHNIEVFNAAAKTMKCLQMANGAAYVDDKGTYTEVHNVKLEALDSIISEASGAPILVAYHFRSDLDRLQRAFPHGKTLDKNPKTVEEWNKGKIPLLFVHPASAGHGLNLQHGGNILVFYSVNWDLELHEQVIERIGPARQKQSGYDRPVFLYFILAEGTIDYDVYERLATKKSVQEILMAAMAKR